MPDDGELAGLDPFAIWEDEVVRLERFLAALPAERWEQPSRCAGWSVRDVLAHLLASEDYNRACLDGTVPAYMAGLGARGATDLDSANALGVADHAGRAPDELLGEWHDVGAENRRRLRERGDGMLATSVGDYPSRWQAFHLAAEVATHGDDVGVEVDPADRAGRLDWRARFSRFAIAEMKPELTIDGAGGRTHIRGDGVDVDLDDETLVAAATGRLGDESGIDAATRELLSAT